MDIWDMIGVGSIVACGVAITIVLRRRNRSELFYVPFALGVICITLNAMVDGIASPQVREITQVVLLLTAASFFITAARLWFRESRES